MIKKELQFFVFCDGGARGNPGPAATGFLIKDKTGKTLVEKGSFIGKTTNNVAEYQAVIAALKFIINHFRVLHGKQSPFSTRHSPIINFYLDSLLVVNQLTGRFKIKNNHLMALVIKIKKMEKQIKAPIFFHYIPREKINWQISWLIRL